MTLFTPPYSVFYSPSWESDEECGKWKPDLKALGVSRDVNVET